MPIAGVDEAGRGPLAGPVVAGAVILDPIAPLSGLKDSKKLTAKQREKLFDLIYMHAVSVGVAVVEPIIIDKINILQASLQAMQLAVAQLKIKPKTILIDGNQAPFFDKKYIVKTIIGGDDIEPAISAASVIAKVTRDRIMVAYEKEYPGYGFAAHKGYPTASHKAALLTLGVSPIHRLSFAPVRKAMLEFA